MNKLVKLRQRDTGNLTPSEMQKAFPGLSRSAARELYHVLKKNNPNVLTHWPMKETAPCQALYYLCRTCFAEIPEFDRVTHDDALAETPTWMTDRGLA